MQYNMIGKDLRKRFSNLEVDKIEQFINEIIESEAKMPTPETTNLFLVQKVKNLLKKLTGKKKDDNKCDSFFHGREALSDIEAYTILKLCTRMQVDKLLETEMKNCQLPKLTKKDFDELVAEEMNENKITLEEAEKRICLALKENEELSKEKYKKAKEDQLRNKLSHSELHFINSVMSGAKIIFDKKADLLANLDILLYMKRSETSMGADIVREILRKYCTQDGVTSEIRKWIEEITETSDQYKAQLLYSCLANNQNKDIVLGNYQNEITKENQKGQDIEYFHPEKEEKNAQVYERLKTTTLDIIEGCDPLFDQIDLSHITQTDGKTLSLTRNGRRLFGELQYDLTVIIYEWLCSYCIEKDLNLRNKKIKGYFAHNADKITDLDSKYQLIAEHPQGIQNIRKRKANGFHSEITQ